jgi:hypothetical protein
MWEDPNDGGGGPAPFDPIYDNSKNRKEKLTEENLMKKNNEGAVAEERKKPQSKAGGANKKSKAKPKWAMT